MIRDPSEGLRSTTVVGRRFYRQLPRLQAPLRLAGPGIQALPGRGVIQTRHPLKEKIERLLRRHTPDAQRPPAVLATTNCRGNASEALHGLIRACAM